jgi:hypothetical protein
MFFFTWPLYIVSISDVLLGGQTYRLLNAIVAHFKNYPFGVVPLLHSVSNITATSRKI